MAFLKSNVLQKYFKQFARIFIQQISRSMKHLQQSYLDESILKVGMYGFKVKQNCTTITAERKDF